MTQSALTTDVPERHLFLAMNAVAELAQNTHRASVAWGLGAERTWTMSANAATLYLRAEDDILAEYPMQVVGRFDPQHDTFQWAWSGDSFKAELCEHALGVRRFGEQGDWHALTRESAFPSSMAQAWEFAALATHLSGAFSAYRAVDSQQRSVLMTLGKPSFRDPIGMPIALDDLPDPETLCTITADDATDLVKSFCFEIFTLEELFQQHSLNATTEGEKVAARERALGDMRMVYAQHWRRADTKWVPSQIRWPSDHEFMRFSHWRTIPMRDSGRMVVFEDPGTMSVPAPFVVRSFDDGLRITRRDRSWGDRIFRPDHRLIDQNRSLYFSQTAARE